LDIYLIASLGIGRLCDACPALSTAEPKASPENANHPEVLG
jgi:hypothetical protein